MSVLTAAEILEFDQRYVWHPYSPIHSQDPIYPVQSARGCVLTLSDGRQLIDGTSSWWSAIHGYNHPVLNRAAHQQIDRLAHIMFAGLTHEPAAALAKKLVEITPSGLDHVFFSDSGSVSVEVAIKMAIQYWLAQGQPRKSKLVSLGHAYHGDTLGAMSVCDPASGMHHLFKELIPQNIFVEAPVNSFHCIDNSSALSSLEHTLKNQNADIAAVIVEPILQGAGGMRFYSPDYLANVHVMCEKYNVLLIADEIATGFGRTGKIFACEHANISPDILCLGKALTGGYLTLAATLCSKKIAEGISAGGTGAFMHGPTFMANPLACAVANASVDLLMKGHWQTQTDAIAEQMESELTRCASLSCVKAVRVLGAIGVVELKTAVDRPRITEAFIEQGIWLRPFGNIVYTMPPYIISRDELTQITGGIYSALKSTL